MCPIKKIKKKKKKTSVYVDLIQKCSVNFYSYKELKKLTERVIFGKSKKRRWNLFKKLEP